ncbi:MurR/RpiR family transcriptional regulator [Miniimonas arenae]|uniref:MurR/RpiR family transcriptional regulator n=2 Tax=Miniimonas arenae TaxID=676201 RepID=UPI0028AF7B39|nr:MurR/RpiR family transcriptional regulator [Miniimonas arenae]
MDRDPLTRIAQAMPTLSRAEARVATFLAESTEEDVARTIGQLADEAGVSQATVVRLSKSLGYAGYPDLRIALAGTLSRRAADHERENVAQGALSASDSVGDIVMKLAFHEARTIEETARVLDLEALEAAAEAVAAAPRVLVAGIGASGIVAQDLTQKLQRIGRHVLHSADPHVQLQSAALLEPGDVAIGISFGGRTVETHHLLEVAARAGARTVGLTNVPESPIARAVDVALTTSARELPYRVGAFSSRIAQLAVGDMLFVLVAQRHYDATTAALRRTYDVVQPQKLHPRRAEPADRGESASSPAVDAPDAP